MKESILLILPFGFKASSYGICINPTVESTRPRTSWNLSGACYGARTMQNVDLSYLSRGPRAMSAAHSNSCASKKRHAAKGDPNPGSGLHAHCLMNLIHMTHSLGVFSGKDHPFFADLQQRKVIRTEVPRFERFGVSKRSQLRLPLAAVGCTTQSLFFRG